MSDEETIFILKCCYSAAVVVMWTVSIVVAIKKEII